MTVRAPHLLHVRIVTLQGASGDLEDESNTTRASSGTHACKQITFPLVQTLRPVPYSPLEPTPSMDRAAGIALQKEPAWACTDLSNSDAPMCGSLSGSRYGNRSKFEVPRLGSIPDPELSDLEMLHDVGALPGQGADRGRRVRPDFYKPVRQPEIFERIADLSSLMAGLHSRVGLRLS